MPKASSPTRSLFSSVWQYSQNSFSKIFAIAVDFDEARVFDFERERRGLQVAVFAVEVIAGGGIADEGAVDCGGSGEDFAGGEIGPVARADEAAGLDPVEAAIEVGVDGCAGFGANGERLRAEHAFAEFVAEAIDHFVVGAHALLHDLRSDADHVGVANLAALDDFDDGHAGAEFAGLRGHGHDADVGFFERVENERGGGLHRARAEVFEKQRCTGVAVV